MTQLILDGAIKTPGVHAPYTKELCDPIHKILESEGLGLVEKVLWKCSGKRVDVNVSIKWSLSVPLFTS